MPPNSTTPPVVWPCACRLFKAPSKRRPPRRRGGPDPETGHSPPGGPTPYTPAATPESGPASRPRRLPPAAGRAVRPRLPGPPVREGGRARGAGKAKRPGRSECSPGPRRCRNLGLLSGPQQLPVLIRQRSQGEVGGGRADGRSSAKGLDGPVGGRAIRSVSCPGVPEP